MEKTQTIRKRVILRNLSWSHEKNTNRKGKGCPFQILVGPPKENEARNARVVFKTFFGPLEEYKAISYRVALPLFPHTQNKHSNQKKGCLSILPGPRTNLKELGKGLPLPEKVGLQEGIEFILRVLYCSVSTKGNDMPQK